MLLLWKIPAVSLLTKICFIVFTAVSILYLGYFKIGKVTDIKEKDINITLFQYNLHVKTEQIIEHDVLLNFGNIGLKTIFELSDQKQNILINKVIELGMELFILIEKKIISNLF